jgi:hypothetical protein
MIIMIPSWQKRRSDFNHDWMKNKYIQALGDWHRLLNDEQEDEDLEKKFVSDVLPQWESHSAEAFALPRNFKTEMSPRVLFKKAPLSRCDEDTKKWLGEVIHNLWLVRYAVRQRINDTTTKASSANLSYLRLQKALKMCPDTRSAASLRPLRPFFEDFCKCCQSLTGAMEKFPSEVKAI